MINPDAHYTAREAAEILRCHERTVRRRIGDGTIKATVVASKYLILGREIDAALNPPAPKRTIQGEDDFSAVARELLESR